MLECWSRFQMAGFGTKAENEREIFEELFAQNGKAFFDQCGTVVSFLETQGTGKAGTDGSEGKIHSPMVWMRNHWEMNLTRYQNWNKKEAQLNEAHSKRISLDAKSQVKASEKELARLKTEQEEAAWIEKMNATAERFLANYRSESKIQAFVTEAIDASGCAFTRGFWKKDGWHHPAARTCVLEHFLKVESGERTTQVQPENQGEKAYG